MDTRLITLGVMIIVVSTGFLVYGAMTGAEIVTGSALASMIPGLVFTVIGLTYRDPVVNILSRYASTLSSGLVKTYEDLGLLDNPSIKACYSKDSIWIVFSREPIECGNLKPGLGVEKNVPYLSLYARPIEVAEEDLSTVLMRNGLAHYAMVTRDEDRVVVDLHGTLNPSISGGRAPLNLYQVLIPLYVASYYSRHVMLAEEELGEDYYKAVFEVVDR